MRQKGVGQGSAPGEFFLGVGGGAGEDSGTEFLGCYFKPEGT